MPNEIKWPGFGPAELLIPQGCDMEKWSVVACDQYTSQPEYWERVDRYVGEVPSTLRMILPEALLGDGRTFEHVEEINGTMERYLDQGLFRVLPDALVYVERWLADGVLQRGIVGAVDLEQYDYNDGSDLLVRATEGTVLSRIPPRLAIRRNAALELSHVVLLLDDPEREVVEHLTGETDEMELLYDFDLMEEGGHITGYLLNGEQKAALRELLVSRNDPEAFAEKYGAHHQPVMLYAVGDGNHSLATARAAYMEKKEAQPERDWLQDPARYAMVELMNLHDDSLCFEAIHRVCFAVEPEKLLEALLAYYPGTHYGEGEGQSIRYVWEKGEGVITIPNPVAQLAVGSLQGFLDYYFTAYPDGGYVDYVHGESVAAGLGRQPGSLCFLLPAMSKDDLFKGVIFDGALPRKTFSIGKARDKRFYLEARRIK